MEFYDFLADLGCADEDGLPLEICTAIAEGLATASGFRVMLQAEILQPTADDPNISTCVGHHEIATAEPMLFVTPAPPEMANKKYQRTRWTRTRWLG